MAIDTISMAGNKAKGKRPQYFKDGDSDRLMAILMAVAGELAVARERIDTLERLLEKCGVLKRQDIEQYAPDTEAAHERGLCQQDYIARILRVIQQEIEQVDENHAAAAHAKEHAAASATNDLEELIDELASS